MWLLSPITLKEEIADFPSLTNGKKQCYSAALGLGTHLHVTLTRTTHLRINDRNNDEHAVLALKQIK